MLYSKPFENAIEFHEANNQLQFNACLNLLSQISDQAQNVSRAIQKRFSEIQWKELRLLRSELKFDLDLEDQFVIFLIIKESVPELISSISKIIKGGVSSGHFHPIDIELAKTSQYLKHVNFDLIGNSLT